MTRYGMVIDISRCNGCYNCFIACRDEYCGNEHLPHSAAQPEEGHFWMRIIEKERGKYPQAVKVAYTPLLCMQCGKAGCIEASRDGEIYRRKDGIVIIDPVKAKGKKELLTACPYRVIYWNEEKSIPQKCTFCAHLIDEGREPRCVEACPTRALKFGDLDDANGEVAKIAAAGKTEALHPGFGLKENVTYLGIPKRLIGGSVVFADKDECAADVEITLTQGKERKVIRTDRFGDFEFDGLTPNTQYSVVVESKGYASNKFDACTNADIYLGEIFLEKSKPGRGRKS